MTHSFAKLSAAVMAVMGLTACGWGGSSSNNNEETGATSLHVMVIDGYLENSQVYADLNRNYTLDDGDIQATVNTGSDGTAVIDIPNSLLKDSAGSEITHARVISQSAQGDKNTIYGAETQLGHNLVMAREIYIDRNNPDAVYTITPFTTMAAMAYTGADSANLSQADYENTVKQIANAAGASAAASSGDIFKDYNLNFVEWYGVSFIKQLKIYENLIK